MNGPWMFPFPQTKEQGRKSKSKSRAATQKHRRHAAAPRARVSFPDLGREGKVWKEVWQRGLADGVFGLCEINQSANVV